MAVRGLVVALLLLLPAGCFLVQPSDDTLFNGSVADEAESFRPSPVPVTAKISVRFINNSGSAADTRVTMRVDGLLVHRSERRLDPLSDLLSVGPDEAQSVVVEVTLTAPVRQSLPIATFRLGADFRSGDTITITIPADPPTIEIAGLNEDLQVDPGEPVAFSVLTSDAGDDATVRVFADADRVPDNGNELSIADGLAAAATIPIVWDTQGAPQALYEIYAELVDGEDVIRSGRAVGRVRIADPCSAPSLTIAIGGLDEDVRINAGTAVRFDIVTTNAGSTAEVRVLADPDADPENGNELIIGDRLAAALFEFVWDTTGVAPATYSIYAELNDACGVIRTGPAAGRVRINAQPEFVFVDPRENLIVTLGRTFMVTWAAQDDDDDALINIFLDRNNDFSDGIERLLAEGISEDDIENRELTVDTSDLDPEIEEIFVGARISDGLTTLVIYTGRVCLTSRLVGRFTPADLGEGDITIIRGGANSSALGAAIDVTGSNNPDQFADLIVGDPLARDGAGSRPGAAYLHRGAETWPREISIDDVDVTFLGESDGSHTGQRVGLLQRSRSGGARDVLIGAPLLFDSRLGFAGRAYRIDGPSIQPGTTIDLSSINLPSAPIDGSGPCCDTSGSTITGSLAEQTGLDVAALGDLDGDGTADYALGGAGYSDESSEGRVVIISGDSNFGRISADDVGRFERIRGAHAFGDDRTALVGHAVRTLRDVDGDGTDELLISAPAAEYEQVRVGLVYMLFGEQDFFNPQVNHIFLRDVGIEGGRLFVGENDGDMAGASLATGNFDGLPGDELLIGAPGYDNARGRIYLISIDPDAPLPSIVHLSDVGSEKVPGVIFEGMAPGDQLGLSLANAGDVDGDFIDDMIFAAPGVQGQLGAAFLIYGGQPLDAVTTLFEMPSCERLQGWQLTGDVELGRLGAAVSGGGDLNADLFADVGIGAPGNPSGGGAAGGAAYLIFGRGQLSK